MRTTDLHAGPEFNIDVLSPDVAAEGIEEEPDYVLSLNIS